jgi:hypothetical protein
MLEHAMQPALQFAAKGFLAAGGGAARAASWLGGRSAHRGGSACGLLARIAMVAVAEQALQFAEAAFFLARVAGIAFRSRRRSAYGLGAGIAAIIAAMQATLEFGPITFMCVAAGATAAGTR